MCFKVWFALFLKTHKFKSMKKFFFLSAIIMYAFIMHAMPSFHPDTLATNKSEKTYSSKKAEKLNRREAKKYQADYKVLKSYNKSFDTKVISWSKGSYFDIASYMNEEGQICHAYFDNDAQLCGITMMSSIEDIPERAQKFINKHYSDYTIQKVVFYDDCADASNENIQLSDELLRGQKRHVVYLYNGKNQLLVQVSKAGAVYRFK